MSVLPLSKLSDWVLEDDRKDLRGRKLVDSGGRTIGTIDELLVDTDRARVDSVRTEDGRLFAVEPLQIRDSEVIFLGERSALENEACCGPIAVRSHSNSRARDFSTAEERWLSGSTIRNTGVIATDGELGKIDDIYFDDQDWTIRYLVVDTSKWLLGRKVLISPEAIVPGTISEDSVQLNLTRDQIRDSPSMDTERPVSSQWLSSLHSYYGWGVPGVMPGTGIGYPMVPGSFYGVGMPMAEEAVVNEPLMDASTDQHLRSMKEVIGHHIQALDGDKGHVDDLAIDPATLRIRFLIVDTSNLPGGRSVMVPVSLVMEMEWPSQTVRVQASKEEIANMRESGPALRQ